MSSEQKPLPLHQQNDFVTRNSDFLQLLNSIIVPRPIAFVTTIGANGVINAAPFSYFSVACTDPPIISIAIERRGEERKDTPRNILYLKEFVVNICPLELAKTVSIAGGDYPPHVSEVELTNLCLIASEKISVPRIANTPVQIECILHQIVGVGRGDLILGRVVNVHLHKEILNAQGRVATEKLNPLARIAGSSFAKVSDFIEGIVPIKHDH